MIPAPAKDKEKDESAVPLRLTFGRRDLLTACWGNGKAADLLWHLLNRANWAVRNKHLPATCPDVTLPLDLEETHLQTRLAKGSIITYIKRFTAAHYLSAHPYGRSLILHLGPIEQAFTTPPSKPVLPTSNKKAPTDQADTSNVSKFQFETLREEAEQLRENVANLQFELETLKLFVANVKPFVANVKLFPLHDGASPYAAGAFSLPQNPLDVSDLQKRRDSLVVSADASTTGTPLSLLFSLLHPSYSQEMTTPTSHVTSSPFAQPVPRAFRATPLFQQGRGNGAPVGVAFVGEKPMTTRKIIDVPSENENHSHGRRDVEQTDGREQDMHGLNEEEEARDAVGAPGEGRKPVVAVQTSMLPDIPAQICSSEFPQTGRRRRGVVAAEGAADPAVGAGDGKGKGKGKQPTRSPEQLVRWRAARDYLNTLRGCELAERHGEEGRYLYKLLDLYDDVLLRRIADEVFQRCRNDDVRCKLTAHHVFIDAPGILKRWGCTPVSASAPASPASLPSGAIDLAELVGIAEVHRVGMDEALAIEWETYLNSTLPDHGYFILLHRVGTFPDYRGYAVQVHWDGWEHFLRFYEPEQWDCILAANARADLGTPAFLTALQEELHREGSVVVNQ